MSALPAGVARVLDAERVRIAHAHLGAALMSLSAAADALEDLPSGRFAADVLDDEILRTLGAASDALREAVEMTMGGIRP